MSAPLREIHSADRVPTTGRARGVIVGMVCGHQKFIGGDMQLSLLLGTRTQCISGCYVPEEYMGA